MLMIFWVNLLSSRYILTYSLQGFISNNQFPGAIPVSQELTQSLSGRASIFS